MQIRKIENKEISRCTSDWTSLGKVSWKGWIGDSPWPGFGYEEIRGVADTGREYIEPQRWREECASEGYPFLPAYRKWKVKWGYIFGVLWKESLPASVSINSPSGRGPHKPSLGNRMCRCMERAIKAVVATSLISGGGATMACVCRLCPVPASAELTAGAKT